MKHREERLDALMTACHYDRYFDGDGWNSPNEELQGLMVHSPYQLADGIRRAFPIQLSEANPIQPPNPYFQQKWIHDFRTTPLIITRGDFFQTDFNQEFIQQFTLHPASCALPYLPIEGMKVYFRKG